MMLKRPSNRVIIGITGIIIIWLFLNHFGFFHPNIDGRGVYFLLAVCDIAYDHTNSLAAVHRCAGCGAEINSTVCVSYSKIDYLDDGIKNIIAKGGGTLETHSTSDILQRSGEYRVVAYIPADLLYPKYKFEITEILERDDKSLIDIAKERFRKR